MIVADEAELAATWKLSELEITTALPGTEPFAWSCFQKST